MMIRPRMLIVLTILCLGSTPARAAEDGCLLEDRFETDRLDGKLWNLQRGFRPGATYELAHAETANNHFVRFVVLDDTPASVGGSSVELGAANQFPATGRLTISFDFFEPAGPLTGSLVVRALRAGARAVSSRGNFAYSVGFCDGWVGDSKDVYSLDRVHHADIVINNTERPVGYFQGRTLAPFTADVWIDGKLGTTGVTPAMKGDIRGVGFAIGSSDRQAMAIDNVRVLRGETVVQSSPSAAIAMAPISEKQAARYSMATWPAEPIMVSPTESVIEAFWLPRVTPALRWKASGGSVSTGWDASVFRFNADEPGDVASMTRTYDIDLAGYRRMRMRLRPGEAVRTTIVGIVDGREHAVVDAAAGSNDAFELVGPIRGERLTGLTVRFQAEQAGKHNVQLRWILLEKDGMSWAAPETPFEGMVVNETVGRFDPGLGLVFGAEELDRMRRVVATPAFETVWKADLQYAANQYELDPASLIRPYSLYALTRYGRDSDLQYETVHDGVILALVGVLSRNEEYLRQAARHAVALARIEHWSEGFVDRMPGYHWYHAGFAPNVATIKASLLLDWTWHYLTPDGRKVIREAIAKKGLPYVERAKNAMANQGVRFNKGMILGKMALADSLDDPELRKYVRECIDRINGKLSSIVRPDGTFSEAMNYYGKGTMACTPISYHAASRCLGVPVAKLVSPRMLPAMRFILTADGRLNAGMAAFCAGPLGDETFASQCVPTGLLHNFVDADFPTGQHEGNRVEYIFFGLAPLWAPALLESQQQPALPSLSVYRDGGWVFGGSDDPAAPRFSFESGLWDGHGHSWFHKNAITLDRWGERLLVSRMHLPYSDARSQYTMQTKLYNTFAPSGRNQNASGTRGRGAKLLAAEDSGPIAIVESDNATAWRSGVKRAVRRVLFIRPNVLIIHDDAEFTKPEPGVQSWNSFQPWKHINDRTCEARLSLRERCATFAERKATIAVRLTAVTSQPMRLTSEQDSVSREGSLYGPIEVPVYRAAFTTDSAARHNVLTIIEAIGPDKSERPVVRARETDQMIEIHSAGRVVQILTAHDEPTVGPLSGFASDGRFLFTVREKGEITHAGTFGASWLQTPEGSIKGKGFLRWPAVGGGAVKSQDETRQRQ